MLEFKTITIFLPVIFILYEAANTQHIFENSHSPCHYGKNNNLTFHNEIIRIKSKSLDLLVNFCGPLQNVVGCDMKAAACSVRGTSRHIPNLGVKFIYETTEEGETVLTSTGGTACPDGGSYKVIVHFETHKINNSFSRDDCEFNLKILNPKISPPCTTRDENGFLLNLLPLKKEEDLIVNSTFALSFCRQSNTCNENDVSACILGDGQQRTAIASASEVRLDYNFKSNALKVIGKIGSKRRGLKKTEINLKCNWDVVLGNPKKLPGNYKFEVESKYGCVKLPMNCTFSDIRGYIYNLSALNKPQGWGVTNVPSASMLINVCGPLKLGANKCSNMYSQVCLNGAENYGSTYLPFREEDNDIYLELRDGSICPVDPTQRLTTKVKFVCSNNERGPLLLHSVNCTQDILWQTPEACPKYLDDARADLQLAKPIKIDDIIECTAWMDGKLYNLSALTRRANNYKLRGSSGIEFHINICAPLVMNSHTKLCLAQSVCLYNESEPNIKEKFIGLGTPVRPQVDNDELIMKFQAGYCKHLVERNTIIHFQCSQQEGSPRFLKENNCVYEFTWSTKYACPIKAHRPRAVGCTLRSGDKKNILNFDNRIKTIFIFENANSNYTFDLCHENYTLSSNPGETLNAVHVELKNKDCQPYLEYNLTSEVCTDNKFQRLLIHFVCDESLNNQYSNTADLDNCTANINLYTREACKFTGDLCLALEEHHPLQQKARNCTVRTNKDETIELHDLQEIKVRSKMNEYVIGYNSSGSNCYDFVCKNRESVASMNLTCPNIEVDPIVSRVVLHFSEPGCNEDNFLTDIILTCKDSENNIPKMQEETKCSVKIEVPYLKCTTLHPYSLVSVIVGITLLLLGISVVVFGILRRRRSLYLPCNDKSTTRIYERNTQL